MPSFLFSPLSSSSSLLLLLLFFLFLSLPTPISSHRNLLLRRNPHSFNKEEHTDDSPIPKSKTLPKKKPISEFPEPKNKTKSLKPKPTNSTSFSSSKLDKILSGSTDTTTSTKSKLNKTLSTSPTATKNKLDKTAITGDLSIISASKFKLNKTSSATKKNTTKSNFDKVTLLKSNFTKIGQLKSLNPAPKIQKKLDAEDPHHSKPQSNQKLKPQASTEKWLDEADITGGNDDDLVSEFRDLPYRLHSAIVPDLEKLSTTSKLYLSKTHREIATSVKPFVGNKYAPSIASAASSSLLLLPLFLVTVLFRLLLRTGTSASLHRALLFVQAYLAIYFATLSLTAVLTGLEPLLFFYAASPGAYAWTQAVQTLGYLAYLVAQLIALVVAFSAGEGESEGERKAGKVVGLSQMLLGLAVGMHYYITVFHRAVTGEAPRANWKVHGIYAICFFVISGLSRAERRKKAYLQGDGVDDGKKS